MIEHFTGRAAVFCCSIFVLASNGASAAPATFTLEDTYKITGISSPRFSPDGKQLVFVRSHVNLQTDRRDPQLVLLDIATHAERVLTDRAGVGDPQWSPRGDAIAFLATEKNQSQVYVMPMNGGDAVCATNATQGVEQYTWRPDGNAVAYVTSDEPAKQTGLARWQDAFRVTDNAYLDPGPFLPAHLWLATQHESATGEQTWSAKRLTHGRDWTVAAGEAGSTISFSPDGTRLTYVRLPNALLGDADRSVVEVLDVATGRSTPLSGRSRFEFNPRISPDGHDIAYTYARDGDAMNAADIFLSAGSGAGSDISRAMDRNTTNYAWYPGGKSLLIDANDGTQRALWKLDTSGSFQRFALGDVSAFGDFDGSISRDGAVAFVGATPHHPAEVYYAASPTATPVVLTHENDVIASRQFGEVRGVDWRGPNGFHEDGVLTYPVGYALRQAQHDKTKYPLVLLIHGGPTGASTTSFDELAQLMAARGWFVLQPNYRGSDNLGNAYQHAIYIDATAGPGEDIMAGVHAVEGTVPIDASRIAVSGWSYGGMMTSWMITHYHIWNSAVSGAAVNDLVYDYALADDISADRESMPGSPFVGNNLQLYQRVSPLTYYRDVRTPTLILSDVYDVRVPSAQSYAFYHALRDNGVPVEFYQWPVHGHFPGDPVRIADVYRHWMGWIASHFTLRD
ncbi:MAG: prolyl oligopeptidase family serine peptidase [Vulcanimicrobiaceae bacterium]